MSDRQVLRWEVGLDDRDHEVGGGPVVMVQCRPPRAMGLPPRVEVWTEELLPDGFPGGAPVRPMRLARVFGTGHPLPVEAFRHLGSALDQSTDGALVWHVYEIQPE